VGVVVDRPSKPDPVLEHLLRSVRSKHVRHIFFSNPASAYTSKQEVKILVGSCLAAAWALALLA
jgi:hypothetical protein